MLILLHKNINATHETWLIVQPTFLLPNVTSSPQFLAYDKIPLRISLSLSFNHQDSRRLGQTLPWWKNPWCFYFVF